MTHKYPHTIENCVGEKIIFQSEENTPEGIKVHLEGFCQPGCGPVFHAHLKQEESLTVVSGKMGYQFYGEAPQYLNPGETATFKRGSIHKFWAEGSEVLHVKGWVAPAHSIVFYLSTLYAAQQKSGQPEAFTGAYLGYRYRSEYEIPEIPGFVKKVIFPVTYFIGNMLGKYKNFKGAPEPVS